jgi:hypothetical protein
MWVARQRGGKTTALMARARAIVELARVRSVWVCDLHGEWSADDFDESIDVLQCVRVGDYLREAREEMPEIVLFQLGPHGEAYWDVFKEAIAEGDVCLFLDEAYEHAPNAGVTWSGSDDLKRIVYAGRHLANCQGDVRPTHLVCATQYPRSVNPRMIGQAEYVLVSSLEGARARGWLRDEFGDEALDEVSKLRPFQWYPARVPPDKPRKVPRLVGYGPR